ncbi:hypothetical protein [Clostridium sp.]|jgi:hypothetical protein
MESGMGCVHCEYSFNYYLIISKGTQKQITGQDSSIFDLLFVFFISLTLT